MRSVSIALNLLIYYLCTISSRQSALRMNGEYRRKILAVVHIKCAFCWLYRALILSKIHTIFSLCSSGSIFNRSLVRSLWHTPHGRRTGCTAISDIASSNINLCFFRDPICFQHFIYSFHCFTICIPFPFLFLRLF